MVLILSPNPYYSMDGVGIMIKRLAFLFLMVLLVMPVYAAPPGPVHVLRVVGQIDPAVADYIADGIRAAENDGAHAVMIVLDTPGGLVSSTQKIIQTFFASRVPVIVYVSPEGAWAGSAGVMITMGADVAVMAPGTSIGAATPVSASPGGGSEEMDDTMKRKQVNFTAEYARSIAEKRGRNADWAEAAVREAATLTADKAAEKKVIDFVAATEKEALQKADGRQVELSGGRTVTLRTADAQTEERPMGPWVRFLHLLSNPFVMLFLTLGAMYGIIYELSNPGAIVPGTVGAICILLLLYSYSVIPVNTAGLAFIALALLFFGFELFTPTNGVLTAGGIASMFIGLMMLFRSVDGFMVPIWVLVAVALATGGFFFFLLSMGMRALRNPYVAGREGVVGLIGEVRTELDPTGHVFVDGALWTATSENGAIAKGEHVEVTEMTGLRLKVRRVPEDSV